MTAFNDLNRREILHRMTLIMGGSLSLSLITACDNGVQAPSKVENLDLKALSKNQFDLVGDIANAIIPDTDTLGAKAVHVDYLIDDLVANWMRPQERVNFLSDLDQLDAKIIADYSKRFSDLSATQQSQVLDQLGTELNAAIGKNPRKPIYRELREMTLFGYYTCEVGASQELLYDPIPGGFKGCVAFDDIGKAWAIE